MSDGLRPVSVNPVTGVVSYDVSGAADLLAADPAFTGTYAQIGSVTTHTASSAGNPVPSGITGGWITTVNSGAGGGSGRRGAGGTVRCGGGAGASGSGQYNVWMPASAWGATYDVVIGAGGVGGAAVTTDNTDGNSGGTGAVTSVSSNGWTVRGYVSPNAGGKGGTATSGAGGTAGSPFGISGASASGSGGAGTTGNNSDSPLNAPPGSGSGGGITSGDVPGNGGAGGNILHANSTNRTGGIVGGAGPQGQVPITGDGLKGLAAGGGAASITGPAQNGADGGNYGAGGAGGGASLNGNNSGAGGVGAPGVARIVWSYA